MRKNKMWRKRALALAVGVSMVLAGAPARVSRGADAEKVYAAAYQNASSVAETTLPETVQVGGNQEIVTWSLRSSKFAVPYETVEIKGTTESGQSVLAMVEVIPDEEYPLVYFVDAGREGAESKAYTAVKELAGSSLKNEAADQLLAEEASWGRKSTYHVKGTGGLDVTDKYQTGVYGENDKVNSVSWQFELEAGEYTVHMGCLEWWQNSRTM